jgi:hypothetical protein
MVIMTDEFQEMLKTSDSAVKHCIMITMANSSQHDSFVLRESKSGPDEPDTQIISNISHILLMSDL